MEKHAGTKHYVHMPRQDKLHFSCILATPHTQPLQASNANSLSSRQRHWRQLPGKTFPWTRALTDDPTKNKHYKSKHTTNLQPRIRVRRKAHAPQAISLAYSEPHPATSNYRPRHSTDACWLRHDILANASSQQLSESARVADPSTKTAVKSSCS